MCSGHYGVADIFSMMDSNKGANDMGKGLAVFAADYGIGATWAGVSCRNGRLGRAYHTPEDYAHGIALALRDGYRVVEASEAPRAITVGSHSVPRPHDDGYNCVWYYHHNHPKSGGRGGAAVFIMAETQTPYIMTSIQVEVPDRQLRVTVDPQRWHDDDSYDLLLVEAFVTGPAKLPPQIGGRITSPHVWDAWTAAITIWSQLQAARPLTTNTQDRRMGRHKLAQRTDQITWYNSAAASTIYAGMFIDPAELHLPITAICPDPDVVAAHPAGGVRQVA